MQRQHFRVTLVKEGLRKSNLASIEFVGRPCAGCCTPRRWSQDTRWTTRWTRRPSKSWQPSSSRPSSSLSSPCLALQVISSSSIGIQSDTSELFVSCLGRVKDPQNPARFEFLNLCKREKYGQINHKDVQTRRGDLKVRRAVLICS